MEEEKEKFMDEAAKVAQQATCLRSKCGCVIVKDGEIIGKGFNSPPKNLESQRRCNNEKEGYGKKVTDKTCCVHAEERAMYDALRNYPGKLAGSKLYFIRLDESGNKSFSKAPYCTICSKIALDLGIKEFILNYKDGIKAYDIEEYNDLSFKYKD